MRTILIALGFIGFGFISLILFSLAVGASIAEEAFDFAYGNDEVGVNPQDSAGDVVQNVEHGK